MNINSNLQMFQHFPQDENQLRGQVEYMTERGKQAPRRKPGDRYTIFGVIAGIIISIILYFLTHNPFWLVVGVIGGAIVGSFIGSLVGKYVVKYRRQMK